MRRSCCVTADPELRHRRVVLCRCCRCLVAVGLLTAVLLWPVPAVSMSLCYTCIFIVLLPCYTPVLCSVFSHPGSRADSCLLAQGDASAGQAFLSGQVK